jgi:apolipoprotein N-acyltransferase
MTQWNAPPLREAAELGGVWLLGLLVVAVNVALTAVVAPPGGTAVPGCSARALRVPRLGWRLWWMGIWHLMQILGRPQIQRLRLGKRPTPPRTRIPQHRAATPTG